MAVASIAKIKSPPTKEEAAFLNSIVKGVEIPPDIEVKEWRKSTEIILRAYRRTELQGQSLMPVLGRFLVIARENKKKFYAEKTFREFLESEVSEKWGVSVATCFEAIGFLRLDLPPDSYEDISRRNLRLLNKAIRVGGEKNSTVPDLVKMAAKLSEDQLREHLESERLINPGASYGGTAIKIASTKKALAMWTNFIAGPEVHKFVGSDKPHRILEAMIDYCQTEFTAQGAAMIEASGELEDSTEEFIEEVAAE